ncbi:MAG TPA: hypothetical protein VHP36_08675 [Chitinispirillaceae bacterium]|nr:hypothetical protein [Chitinispirillaceae bacterium]
MNKLKQFFCSCLLLLILQICFCSLPSDIEPVEWKMRFELPVADKRYTTRDLLKEDLSDEMKIQMGKLDTIGDTVFLFKEDSETYEIDRPLISTDTSFLEEKVGIRTLKNTPQVEVLFEFPGVGGASGLVSVPVPVTFSQAHDNNLNGIQSVTIDETSPALNVTVANTSVGANVENVTVSLLDRGTLIESVSIAVLAAQASTVVPFQMQGKSIHDPITVNVTATIPAGSVLRANEGLSVSFNLDGIMASEAVIVDSLIDYTETFTGSLGLADSMRLNIIDLDQASIACEIKNPCAFKMELTGIIENTWNRDFARNNNIRSIAQLVGINDSSAFAGKVIQDTIFKLPGVSSYNKSIHLDNLRIFPTWDSDSGKSMLNFRYIVHSLVDGRWVRFNKDDIISFKLIPDQFPFVQINGVFTKPLKQDFSSEQKVGFGWDQSILDSLKKSFRFASAQINLSFIPDLPPESKIDSLKLYMNFAEKNKQSGSVVLDKKFIGILPDSMHSANLQLASLLNTWLDTLEFKSQITLPAGTGLELFNRKDEYGRYSTNLSIGINVKWNLKIALGWSIEDTIRKELEPSTFSLNDQDGLEWIDKIKKPKVTINVNALNNTNLHFTLYALCASDQNKQMLMSLPDSMIYSYSPSVDNGPLFRLLGLQGLNLPPRGDYGSIKVELDQRAVDALFSNKDCHIRWFLMIPDAGSDALIDTDFFDIQAKAVIEGIGNSDSLLYWEE